MPDLDFELLKTAGSFAGWGSFLFLLYDRFIKGRPIVALEPGPIFDVGDRDVLLRVLNTSPTSILVTAVEIQPPVYRAAPDDSSRRPVMPRFFLNYQFQP